MITPIKSLTIQQICERKDDLLMSEYDIEELVRNTKHKKNKVIDDFIIAYAKYCKDAYGSVSEAEIRDMKRVAEQLKGGEE